MTFPFTVKPWSPGAALNALIEVTTGSSAGEAMDRAQDALQDAFRAGTMASAVLLDEQADNSFGASAFSLRYAARAVRDLAVSARAALRNRSEPAVWVDGKRESRLVTPSGRVIGRVRKTLLGKWAVIGAGGSHISIKQPTQDAAKSELLVVTGYIF